MTSQHGVDDAIRTRLRILTWNVWWRFGPWEQREPAILATLRDLDADVVALQEVWDDGTTTLAARLAQDLGYHHVFQPSMEMQGFGFGNAVLSRWPIVEEKSAMLYGREVSDEGRLVLFAGVEGPRGRIPVFSTHLNWRFNHSHIRQRQVAEIARFIESTGPAAFPPVLCGDFNAEPLSEEIRMLKGLTTCPVEDLVFHDAWAVAGGAGAGITWDNDNPYVAPKFEPDRRIDYVFLGWPTADGRGFPTDCRVVGNRPVDGVRPSDHYGVLAEARY